MSLGIQRCEEIVPIVTRILHGRPVAVITSIVAVGLVTGCNDRGTTVVPERSAPEKADPNPLGLLDQLGRPVADPLGPGDVSKTQKDTTNRSNATYAHLWLSLDDRDKSQWIDGPGFGEGQKFDKHVERLLAEERILPIPLGTSVEVLELKVPPDKKYVFTDFRVRVLEGEHEGQTGWLSYFALAHE